MEVNSHEDCAELVKREMYSCVENFGGYIENVYVYKDTNYNPQIGSQGTGNGHPQATHRVIVSFVVPCSQSAPVANEEYTIRIKEEIFDSESGDVEGEQTENANGFVDLSIVKQERQSLPDDEENEGTASDLNLTQHELGSGSQGNSESQTSLIPFQCIKTELEDIDDGMQVDDDIEVLSETELNEILESFMDGEIDAMAEEYNAETGFLTLTDQELHETIDQQLSKSIPKNSQNEEWESPLFSDLERSMRRCEIEDFKSPSANVQASETTTSITTIKTEPEDPQFDEVERNSQVDDSRGDLHGCSFATLTTISKSANTVSGIQQQYIPQVTVPLSSVNQVACAMAAAASKTQVLRPSTLPTVSAIIEANGGYNWAIGQSGTKIPIISVSRGKLMQATKLSVVTTPRPVPTSNATLLDSAITTATASTMSALAAKVRTRKTNPLDMKTFRIQQKEEVISQFAALPNAQCQGVPEGHTYESWILQEGLHKVRKLGLHRKVEKDYYPFKCPLCPKQYKNPNGIKYHSKYAHGPKCTFTCPICQRDYATRHGLSAHRRTHQTETVAPKESTTQSNAKNGNPRKRVTKRSKTRNNTN